MQVHGVIKFPPILRVMLFSPFVLMLCVSMLKSPFVDSLTT